MSDPASHLRLPRVATAYACERTLVCCRPPWRVWLLGAEKEAIESRARAAALAAGEGARFEGWAEQLGPAHRLVAQRDNACVMLDEREPACVLQRVAGPGAQPRQCRNFPRSVVATPAGVEAAFLLDCPTVAALVVDHATPFEWATVPLDAWGYAPVMSVGAHVRWEGDTAASFEALEGLRHGWWATLATVAAGGTLLEVLGGLQRQPAEPASREEPALLRCDGPLARAVGAMLARLPARGARYRADADTLGRALVNAPTSAADLAEAAADHVAAWVCAAGLLTQHAGVHDHRPALSALAAVGDQLLRALQVQTALLGLGGVSPRDACLDALTATSHLARLEQHPVAVLA